MIDINGSAAVQDIISLVTGNVQAFILLQESTKNYHNTPQKGNYGASTSSRTLNEKKWNKAKESESNNRSVTTFYLDCGSESNLCGDEE